MSGTLAWARFWSDFPWDERLLGQVREVQARRREFVALRHGNWTLTLEPGHAQIDNWHFGDEPYPLDLSSFERHLTLRLRWRQENREQRAERARARAQADPEPA